MGKEGNTPKKEMTPIEKQSPEQKHQNTANGSKNGRTPEPKNHEEDKKNLKLEKGKGKLKLDVTRPWKPGFDPATKSITTLDIWIRIPGLPAEYISKEVLTSIIGENGLGTVLKLDAFTAKGNQVRYPRICINVDVQTITEKKIYVLDENDEIAVYPVWFEEFPEGCGCCGLLAHTFSHCPLRKPEHEPINITFPKPNNLKAKSAESECEEKDDKDEWVKVTSKNKDKTPTSKFGNPKPKLLKNIGINVNYKTDSSSNGSKSSHKIASHTSTKTNGETRAGVKQPTGPPSSESKMETEDKNAPGDVITGAKVEQRNQLPQLKPNNDENLNNEEMFEESQYDEDLLMEDYEGPIGELTHEELDALLQENPPIQVTPVMAAGEAFPEKSLVTHSSMVVKMGNMGVQGTSTSESSKRNGSFGDVGIASSKLKGNDVKKTKHDA